MPKTIYLKNGGREFLFKTVPDFARVLNEQLGPDAESMLLNLIEQAESKNEPAPDELDFRELEDSLQQANQDLNDAESYINDLTKRIQNCEDGIDRVIDALNAIAKQQDADPGQSLDNVKIELDAIRDVVRELKNSVF